MSLPNLPSTIRAVMQLDPKSSRLTLTETPLPVAGPGQGEAYLVRMKATSPCLDELSWEANFPDVFPADRERVPCTEGAGVVVQPPGGSFGPRFDPGDEVYFRNDAWRRGCLSEYALVPASHVALKPKTLSWVEAAATPLSSLTAHQGLFEHGLLSPAALQGPSHEPAERARAENHKIRVLITGAGGSVGGWAVQLAAAAGAGAVVAVCGPSKVDQVREAGATEVVDYAKQSLADWVRADDSRQCDMVLDCVGGDTLAGCWWAAKPGGVLLSVSASPDVARPASMTKRLSKSTWFLVQPRGRDLDEITGIIERGLARPTVDSVLEFDDYQKAFDMVQTRHAKGKVVLKIN